MNNGIVVHVGYPKAASTTLQKHLFAKHRDVQYYGNYPTNNVGLDTSNLDDQARYLRDGTVRTFYRELLKKDNFQYDPARARGYLADFMSKESSSDHIRVLSHERFLSVLFWNADIAEKARRLRDLLPEAKILIVVRNQRNVVVSQYRNHPFDPRNVVLGKAMRFSKWLSTAFAHDNQIGYLRSLKYSEVLAMYEAYFEPERVKVVCAEDLSNDFKRFAREISEFMSLDYGETVRTLSGQWENIGVPSYLPRMRRYGRLRSRVRWIENSIAGKLGMALMRQLERRRKDAVLTSAMDRRLCEYFSESNHALENYLGERVRGYSYPL